jgi:hypothetical protein
LPFQLKPTMVKIRPDSIHGRNRRDENPPNPCPCRWPNKERGLFLFRPRRTTCDLG